MASVANTGSIADFAWNRIDGVPSAISGTVMQQYAEESVYQIENHTNKTVGTTSIDQKYVPFLVEATVVKTLARMHGIGVDYDWKLGNFSVTRGKDSSSESLQIQAALQMMTKEYNSLGRGFPRYQTFYGK